MLETPETTPESEQKSNTSVRPEVSDFIDTVTKKGILPAIIQLNAVNLDRDEREDVMSTVFDILARRQEQKQPVGAAEDLAKRASALKSRKRGSHILNILK